MNWEVAVLQVDQRLEHSHAPRASADKRVLLRVLARVRSRTRFALQRAYLIIVVSNTVVQLSIVRVENCVAERHVAEQPEAPARRVAVRICV